MDTDLLMILGGHAIALLGILGVGAKFIAGQSGRIATTEHRLATLETLVADLKSAAAETDGTLAEMGVKIAVMETKMDQLIDGQRAMMAILERLRNE